MQLHSGLFDIGCLLFERTTSRPPVPSSKLLHRFLRQIISDPKLVSTACCMWPMPGRLLEPLTFDRIAGIPYGSLPTATGLLTANCNSP